MWPERARLLNGFKTWAHRWHKDWKLIINGIAMMTGRNSNALVDNNVLAQLYCGTRIALNHNRTIRSLEVATGEEVHIGGAWSLGPRAFEIAACGAFQLCDDSRPELAEVFGDTVATYSDAADLRRKAGYYLTHDSERQAMAEASYRRVQLCSFEQRAKQVMIPAIMEVIGHG
jgi:spore maturation protein CgeB